MYEIDIRNIETGERLTVYGYDFCDACRRHKLNQNEWVELCMWYID